MSHTIHDQNLEGAHVNSEGNKRQEPLTLFVQYGNCSHSNSKQVIPKQELQNRVVLMARSKKQSIFCVGVDRGRCR